MKKIVEPADETADELPASAQTGSPAAVVTEFQDRCLTMLGKSSLSLSTNDLAARLRTSRVAVVSAMRSLERKGLAGSHRWPANDQWAALYWFARQR